MEISNHAFPRGNLRVKVIRAPGPGLKWKLRLWLTTNFLFGLIAVLLAKAFSKFTGVPTITSFLSARLVRADGSVVDFGKISHKLITDAGVQYLVDDWDTGTNGITLMNYHGCGTSSTAENVTQTALIAECTAILNPANTRATGTKTQPSANIIQTVGTLTFQGAGGTITEHGLLNQAATGGGTLWDRHVFTGIPVAAGDSIQFTYQCTINSGG